MDFSSFASQGIAKIYAEDLSSQKIYIKNVLTVIRTMEYTEKFLESQCFFVPNNEYMLRYFGSEALDSRMDIYDFDGDCVWNNMLVFPIWGLTGNIMGFVGFDAVGKALRSSGQTTALTSSYRYSSSYLFSRGKYLYTPKREFRKYIADKYMVLVDGVYDMWSFWLNGINAGCSMGSTLSEELLFQLRFIENLYVAEDNDRAGRELYEKLKKVHPGVKYIRQGFSEDADDILKSKFKEEYLNSVRNAIANKMDLTLRSRPRI